jgi:hypothetical protein
MTIDYVVKKKAIDLHLQGRGRNEICRILNSQKMKISEATITHLIQDWKRHHQDSNSESSSQLNESGQVQYQTSVSSIPQKEQQQEDKTQETITISPKTPQCTAINIGMPIIADTGSPSSNNIPHYGDGLKPEPAKPDPDSKTFSGAPLSFFLNKVVSSTAATIITTDTAATANHSISSNLVNFIETDEDTPSPSRSPSSNLHPSTFPGPGLQNLPSPDQELRGLHSFIKDPETEMQVNIEPDVNIKCIKKNQDVTPQDETTEEEEFEQSQPGSPLPDSEMDWDSDENWQRRFFRTILDERKKREEQLRELNKEKQNLTQERYDFEEQKRQIRQTLEKLSEVESLISSAKQLKDIGIGFDQALVWIDCIKEKAEIERIDLRTATWKLAQDLRAMRELGGLSKAIQDAIQQLAMLNMVNEQQKRAIVTSVDLQKAGMTEDEIAKLVKLVGRWNSNTGVGNGGNNTTNNGNNDPNTILKLDDKLNLYKREH